MKRILQKLIIWAYWKLNCHTIEPFSDQLLMYAIPAKMTREQMTTLCLQVKKQMIGTKLEWDLLPIAGCSFPKKHIDNFNEIQLKD